MSACAMLTYNNVSDAAWQCGVKYAADHGVTITSNQSSATVSGFTLAWNYNPAAMTLSLQCTDSPWWAPCSTINSFIDNTVHQCLDQNNVVMAPMV